MVRYSAFRRQLGRRLALTFTTQQDQVLDALDALTPKSVVDRYSNTKRARRASLGDIRVNKIRQMLEIGMGVQRSKMQVRFHEAFLAATSRHLYEEDDNVDWARVRQAQGWADCRSVVLCQVRLVCGQQLALAHTHNTPVPLDPASFRQNLVGWAVYRCVQRGGAVGAIHFLHR